MFDSEPSVKNVVLGLGVSVHGLVLNGFSDKKGLYIYYCKIIFIIYISKGMSLDLNSD